MQEKLGISRDYTCLLCQRKLLELTLKEVRGKVPKLTQSLSTTQACHRQACGRRLSFSFPFCPIFLTLLLVFTSHHSTIHAVDNRHSLCPLIFLVFFFPRISISHCVKSSDGERNGNPLQYSCLENSMGRGTWRATVHGVAKSRTQLSD